MPMEMILTGAREISFREYETQPLGPTQVRALGIHSGISHGTELNLYTGHNPFVEKEFDMKLRMFVPRKEPAPPISHLGYEWVGRVVEIGDRVQSFRPGDLVHLPRPHRETHIFEESETTWFGNVESLPLEPDQAAMLSLSRIALQAIHDARIKVGDHVTIFGMGVIGLLAVQLARINGATRVDAVDPIAARRSWAADFGADHTYDPSEVDVAYAIKSDSPQHGPDVAIELSGNYSALNDAIRTVRMAGTVVAGGYYRGGGTALELGAEWHHNRVTLLSSMGVWQCPHRDYPLWQSARLLKTCIGLLASGELRTEGLITQRIPFREAARAYDLIEKHPADVVKIVLVYEA